jgi:hypothetical protein
MFVVLVAADVEDFVVVAVVIFRGVVDSNSEPTSDRFHVTTNNSERLASRKKHERQDRTLVDLRQKQ